MDTLKFWLAFSVGVAAGATIVLLYAPQTGEKTRKQLKRKLNDTGDYLKDQIDDASGYLKEQASTVSDQAGKAYKKSKSAVSDYSDDLSDNLQAAVKSVKSSVS